MGGGGGGGVNLENCWTGQLNHCGLIPGPWKCIQGWQQIKKISQINIQIILNRYTSRRVYKGTKSANQVAAKNLNQTN